MKQLQQGVCIVAGNHVAAALEGHDQLTLPPGADHALQFALRSLGDVVEQRDGCQHPRPRGRDRVVSGRSRDGLFQACREIAPLGLAQKVLAPVEHQGLLSQVASRRQRPCDGLPAGVGISGDLVIQRLCKAPLGHRRIARDQGLKLLPPGRHPLPLALQQAEPGRPQEQAGMLSRDRYGVVGCLGVQECSAEDQQQADPHRLPDWRHCPHGPKAGRWDASARPQNPVGLPAGLPDAPHVILDCVIATQALPTRPHRGPRHAQENI